MLISPYPSLLLVKTSMLSLFVLSIFVFFDKDGTSTVVCSNVKMSATLISRHSGKIQYRDAVGISTQKSHSLCVDQCIKNKKCLTFFYNKAAGSCVLHSKTFHYGSPDQTESGWNMFLLSDRKYFQSGHMVETGLHFSESNFWTSSKELLK